MFLAVVLACLGYSCVVGKGDIPMFVFTASQEMQGSPVAGSYSKDG